MPNCHSHKVCRQCGKVESQNWKRHWSTRHPNQPIKELVDGELPLEPHRKDWHKELTGDLQTRYFMTLQYVMDSATQEEHKQVP